MTRCESIVKFSGDDEYGAPELQCQKEIGHTGPHFLETEDNYNTCVILLWADKQ